MPLIVSDLNFSQRADGFCYQTGSNKLSVEMYNQESEVREALLLFAVKDADNGALLAINAKRGFNPIGTTSCDVRFEIPDDIDIAQTRATLLVLDANTMQPLATAYTIDPRQSYPYISTPQKTHLLQTLSGTVAKSGENAVTLQATTDTITLPVTPAVATMLSLYDGKACDCFIDIAPDGQRTISVISLQTITVHSGDIRQIDERKGEILYFDAAGERQSVPLDQTLTVYRDNLPIPITDISDVEYIRDFDTNDTYYDFADTDGNGQVDLINIHRTNHAAVVGIDGTNVQTANMGTLDLSQTILTDKTGAAVPLSQLRAGDVLAITWHPGKFRTPYQAVVLPASYVDGTVTETYLSYYFAAIDDVRYDCFIPNSSYPYQFPLSAAMEGRFYLDQYGDIFAVSVQDSFQPYDWLQSFRLEALYHKELILQTSGHGAYCLSENDTLQLQDNTGKITAVTPMDLLSADDFSGTTFAPLFNGQEALPVYELLGNLPILTETATADDLFTHAIGAAYDYTTNRLTLSPLPMSEKTALQDVIFTKADMTLTGDASYPLAPDALLLQAVVQSNQVRVRQVTAEQIPDGAYDMLLYGKDASNRYRAAIFIRATQWLQAQPAIIEQISQTTGDTLTGSVYTQSGRKEIAFAKDSIHANTGEVASLTNLAAGDVILYLTSGDTVQQYLTLGEADPSNPLQFAPTDILSSTGLGIRCIYGYAVANDGETLTIVSGTENIRIAVPADFTVTHADYTALPQNGLTVSPTTIDSVISLNATMSSETPSATPVMACLRNGTLVDLIAFSPEQTFNYAWDTCSMSIITRVSEKPDENGNPVLRLSAVQNGSSREMVYHLSNNSINADTGKATAMTEDFCQGDVVLFYADSAGNVLQYRIVGKIMASGNTPFALEPAFEAEDNGIPHDQYRLGFLKQAYGSRIDLYFPKDAREDSYRIIGANEYCYNDFDARDIRIETGNYYSGSVDDADFDQYYDGKCSYVLVHLRDDEIVDIYSFNQRYPIPEA